MNFKDQKPIYLQIAESICDSILAGKYRENEKLPSVREFAAEVEVNVNTVSTRGLVRPSCNCAGVSSSRNRFRSSSVL